MEIQTRSNKMSALIYQYLFTNSNMLTNRHKYTLKYRQIMRNSGSFEAARASCHPLLVHVRKTYTCGRLKKAEIYVNIVI